MMATSPVDASAGLAVHDTLTPAAPGTVRIAGWVGEKIDRCIANRVAAQDIGRLVEPFRARREKGVMGFRCEYWGKWLTSAVLAYSYEPSAANRSVIGHAVGELLRTQTPDGYIGTYARENRLQDWDVWGRKYVLLGLIAYYDATGERGALEAAERAADCLVRELKQGGVNITELGFAGWKGLPPSSILEPLVLLYQRTGGRDDLELARNIVRLWDRPNRIAPHGLRLIEDSLGGVPPARMASPKAYEMMSCFEGLCELYRVTGERRLLDSAVALARAIGKSERTVVGSGSNHELWSDTARYQTELLEQPQETCVTATWMKLAYQLLRLTGDPHWADELEASLYNALAGAMTPDGSWWAYFSPLIGQRVASQFQHADVELSCCVANGPRALLLTPRWAVMEGAEGPVVNFYGAVSAKVKLPDGTAASLAQQTHYPEDATVRIAVEPERPSHFTLALRIPGWSRRTRLAINGEAIACSPGAYARITRMWKPGDEVTLALDLRGRAVAAPSGAPEFAVMRGPVVMALDNRLAADGEGALRLLADSEGHVDLERHPEKPADIWMAFDVPFEVHPIHIRRETVRVPLCDFASAGNRWTEANRYRVWLPQPLRLSDAYPAGTWKLLAPNATVRPEIPKLP